MYYNLLCIFYLDTVDGNIQITSFNLRNTQYIILHAQLRDPDCLAKQSSDAADRQTVKWAVWLAWPCRGPEFLKVCQILMAYCKRNFIAQTCYFSRLVIAIKVDLALFLILDCGFVIGMFRGTNLITELVLYRYRQRRRRVWGLTGGGGGGGTMIIKWGQ